MWVITRSINQYDQDGDYFVAVFKYKPTAETIAHVLSEFSYKLCQHIANGGGRTKEKEDQWYHLTEVRDGEIYQAKK